MKLKLSKSSRNARVLRGHPWVFQGELQQSPPEEFNGKALPLEDSRGKYLGMGIVNTNSQIAWRRYSLGSDKWDNAFWIRAIQKAALNREDEPYRRVVWSEADDLPGLIVDQFNDVLVVQAVTLAVDRAMPQILEILQEYFEPREILIRNDAPSRKMEGMDLEIRTLSGQPLTPFWATIYEVDYRLDLAAAQKTGFYLDQRQEHFKVATMAADWRVLDCFSNQGSFAINCAKAGAAEVIAVESSEEAVALGKQNAQKNRVSVNFITANVFDYLNENRGEKFNLIILDPPSFARNRKALPGALRGYKELQLRALKMLNPGGILATYCCSQHVNKTQFREVIEEAAQDARISGQILYESQQPTDHPIRLNFPESEYLKGFIVRVN